MNRGISVALLVIGVVLLMWGFNSQDSIEHDVTELVSGTPTDKTMWLFIGGIGASIVGLFGLLRPRAR